MKYSLYTWLIQYKTGQDQNMILKHGCPKPKICVHLMASKFREGNLCLI